MQLHKQFCWRVKRKSGTAIVGTDHQWYKQEACFTRVTQVWLAVNHNTRFTSGEFIRCSKRIARASKVDSLYLCHS